MSCQLCNPVDCRMLGFPVHQQLPELAQTHVHRVGDATQPSHSFHPLLLLPSIFSSIRVFSNDSILHIRWPKYWSFSISPSSEYSGLISFRIYWLDLLAVQGTLKSLKRKEKLNPALIRDKETTHFSFLRSRRPSKLHMCRKVPQGSEKGGDTR